MLVEIIVDLGLVLDIGALKIVFADALDHRHRIDARDGVLFGRVHLRDDHLIAAHKCLAVFMLKIFDQRIAIGFEDADDALGAEVERGLQDLSHAGRVADIILDDRHSAASGNGEAILHAQIGFEAFADGGHLDAQTPADGQGGHGVDHIIMARQVQLELAEHLAAARGLELDGKLPGTKQTRVIFGQMLGGITRGPKRHALAKPTVAVAIQVHERLFEALVGLHKIDHILDDIVEAVVVIKVVELQEVTHHIVGLDIEVRAVALVDLDDHDIALAVTRVRSKIMEYPADNKARFKPGALQNPGNHARYGVFAVGAGDANRAVAFHQVGEHLGAVKHRDAALLRGDQLDIMRRDRGRDHNDLGPVDLRGVMPDRDLDALGAQRLGQRTLANIGAAHLIAALVQDPRDRRNPDSANAQHMNARFFIE